MHFRTELSVTKSLLSLDHSNYFLTIGSCFAEEIGGLLEANKFNVLSNTFGTTFNPISIAEILRMICGTSTVTSLPVHTGEVWLDYRFHSSVYGYNEKELHETIEQKILLAQTQLSKPHAVCILTLGTAWVYRLLENNAVVANCHKQNKMLFQKELCSADALLKVMQDALDRLFAQFPHCKVILTLSPVRHTKDGLEENQVSKSLLRVLCHQLNAHYAQVHYFPAYEIVLDDLRDYRFYARDLVHPNALAVEYIWDKFRQSYFDKGTNSLVDQWNQVQQKLSHKPFYEKTKAHKLFLEQTLQDLEQLNQKLNVASEITELKQILQHHS